MESTKSFSVSKILCSCIRQQECQFLIGGEEESSENILAGNSFLPIVAMHAEINARNTLDIPLGIKYIRDEESLFGVTVNLSPLGGDEMSFIRLAFITDAMIQIFGVDKNKLIECGPVFSVYENGLLQYIELNGAIEWPLAAVSQR